MSEMKKFKTWGRPFSIIGLIAGIHAFVYSISYLISMSVLSGAGNNLPTEGIDVVMTAMLVIIIVCIALGIIFCILGLIGWSKKKFSVTGLVFSLIPIATTALGYLISSI